MDFSNIMVFNAEDVVEGYRFSFGRGTAVLALFLLTNIFRAYLFLLRAMKGRS